jgi:7-cyano-7-deazaguanine synthase
MCSIFGALLWPRNHEECVLAENSVNAIMQCSMERGRDGQGYLLSDGDGDPVDYQTYAARLRDAVKLPGGVIQPGTYSLVGNMRAEPTTEFVLKKNPDDQQPYRCNGWAIAHNGTIANDKELRTNALRTRIDSAAIAEILGHQCTKRPNDSSLDVFGSCIEALRGSYAILATDERAPGRVFYAANYRPIWYTETTIGVFFASSRDYFPGWMVPQMIEPYNFGMFVAPTDEDDCVGRSTFPLLKAGENERALVVCSGGLDSTVAAAQMIAKGYEVELIHFLYGSRAQAPEVNAISAIAKRLGVPMNLFPMDIYDKSDSPLLRDDSNIAGGEEGAEFAHEWVPARNIVMLSIATAYAEAKGFDYIVLGNNLEEAGAYPDNEPEFINRFNDLLPFAVGDGKRVRVVMPVGNLMKHEIVDLGHRLGAPLDLTWSCYRAGDKHCGTCGPCFMRRTAFEINNLEEVIEYEI